MDDDDNPNPTEQVPPAQPPAGTPTQPQDDPPAPVEPPPQAGNNEKVGDLIAKARQEEKNKLYPRITELETEVNTQKTQLTEKDAEIAKLTTELEEAKRTMALSDEDKKEVQQQIEAVRTESDTKIKELETKLENERAAGEINLYREQQINAAGGALIPELVNGGTKEEIDASIATAKTRYTEILAKAQTENNPPAPPPANPSPMPPSNTNLNPADFRNTSNADWAKQRQEVFAKVATEFRPSQQ